jgi:hypothetical protein
MTDALIVAGDVANAIPLATPVAPTASDTPTIKKRLIAASFSFDT